MGITVDELSFLTYLKKNGAFKSVITLGRQGLDVSREILNKKLDFTDDVGSKYCENLLLKKYGATEINSIDNSSYEGATIIHDMNTPFDNDFLSRTFDTVIDGGTTEHIFNFPQAIKNIVKLTSIGGQIIHMLPANNFCGHGFYQFSPELFLTLYSHENGFINTEIFIVLPAKKKWYRVVAPKSGDRINVSFDTEACIFVRTIKNSANPQFTNVQQSDYEFLWSNISEEKMYSGFNSMKELLKKTLLGKKFFVPAWRACNLFLSKFGLVKNMYLIEVKGMRL